MTKWLVIKRVLARSLAFVAVLMLVAWLVAGLTPTQALVVCGGVLLAWLFATYSGLAAVTGNMSSWILAMVLSVLAYTASLPAC